MKKTVLILGSGGREHALVRAFQRSPSVRKVICAPGNAGTLKDTGFDGSIIDVKNISPEDVKRLEADLVVVGPEAMIVDGIADRLEGALVVAPSKEAAQLESSKTFAKTVMTAANVPTAPYLSTSNIEHALHYIKKRGAAAKLVVKADGLCAGKGVIVCKNAHEAIAAAQRMLIQREFGDAGSQIVIEDRLYGREVSIMAMTDGERVVPLPSAEDHKAVFDKDEGPNTGGMGTYSPSPFVTPELCVQVQRRIMTPVIQEMASRGTPYKGILYAGLMLTDDGPFVLEFNCRLGDPETQVVLERVESDLYPWFQGMATGKLPDEKLEVRDDHAVCVVMCAEGYPGKVEGGREIKGLEDAVTIPNVTVYHAGTKLDERTGQILTNGGRVLGVTAVGGTIEAARAHAYHGVSCISWKGEHHRSDIGSRK